MKPGTQQLLDSLVQEILDEIAVRHLSRLSHTTLMRLTFEPHAAETYPNLFRALERIQSPPRLLVNRQRQDYWTFPRSELTFK